MVIRYRSNNIISGINKNSNAVLILCYHEAGRNSLLLLSVGRVDMPMTFLYIQ
jgi:hypothetical protein